MINTQVSHKNAKIKSDIEISVRKELLIVFENKIGAKEGMDNEGRKQLEKYVSLLNQTKGIKNKFLFFITLFPERVKKKVTDSKYYNEIIWSEIYGVIKSHIKEVKCVEVNEVVKKYLLEQFIEYMEAEKMGSFEGFDTNELDVLIKYGQFKENLEKFMPKLKMHLSDGGFKRNGSKNTDICRHWILKNKKISKQNFGAGFYLWNKEDLSWKPGLYCFVYILTDKYKGQYKPLNDVPNKAYIDEHGGISYGELLKDVLGNKTTPEGQVKKLLAFYDKALKEIINFEKALSKK